MMQAERVKWGGLNAVVASGVPRGETPKLIVVLCHGFGAPGSDLVALAQALELIDPRLENKIAYVFPAAPLALAQHGIGGGRAWWMIDLERLIYNPTAETLARFRNECTPGLPDAREKLLALLAEASQHFGLPIERFVLGGFSQGAMLATDVALRLPLAPAALCILSGGLTNEREWLPLAPNRAGLPVLQSHGRHDSVLPFATGEALRDLLVSAGAKVDFLAFNGEHEIPQAVLQRLAELVQRLAEK
jgi:phospholipase/carboxylesterase